MGLYSIIKKAKRKERELRVLVLGLDNAGKTTVVRRLTGEALDSVSPTLGFQISSLRYKLADIEVPYSLNLWDVGGQPSLRAFWRNYFEKTDGVLWVLDSADTARLHEGVKELSALLAQNSGVLAQAPLLVLANKQDAPMALSPDVLKTQLAPLCAHVRVHVEGCSAPNERDSGVSIGMDWLVREMGKRYSLDVSASTTALVAESSGK